MAQSFTMFEKFGEAYALMPAEHRAMFLMAVTEYGMFGTEPSLPYPLNAMFALVREDIDHSKGARETGKRGGRPKGRASEKDVSQNSETGGFENSERGGFQNSETGGFGNCETQNNTIQDSTVQNKAIQNSEGERTRAARFDPPSTEDVAFFAQTQEPPLKIDAARFCDYYTARGWMMGNAPMTDWRAAARNWASRDNQAEEQPAQRLTKNPNYRKPTPEEVEQFAPGIDGAGFVAWHEEHGWPPRQWQRAAMEAAKNG